ncbi:MAG: hypothetical protein QXF76_00135 [Candidatus Anstonellales archaeon]
MKEHKNKFEYIKFNDDKILALDSKEGNIQFISHAHSDHAFAYSKKIKTLCSTETAAIKNFNGNVMDIKEAEKFLNAGLKLLNAGHIFGAKQLHVQSNANSYDILYTGDIRLSDNIITKGAEITNCEELIIDCTYGMKEYTFPKPFEVYEQMKKYYEKEKPDIAVFMGYSIGKAQELVKFVNEYLNQIAIVDKYIAKICKIMNTFGLNLKYLENTSEEGIEMMKKGTYIAVSSPKWNIKRDFHELGQKLNKKCLTIYTTGWAVNKDLSRLCDKAFPLSDHCDFKELVEFVNLCNPKKVYCKYGFTKEFANYLRKNGYEAFSIEEEKKLSEQNICKLF